MGSCCVSWNGFLFHIPDEWWHVPLRHDSGGAVLQVAVTCHQLLSWKNRWGRGRSLPCEGDGWPVRRDSVLSLKANLGIPLTLAPRTEVTSPEGLCSLV